MHSQYSEVHMLRGMHFTRAEFQEKLLQFSGASEKSEIIHHTIILTHIHTIFWELYLILQAHISCF